MRVGVLAVQGDFEKHLHALSLLAEQQPDYAAVEGVEVRTSEDLDAVDRLIIPGGESTTVGLLLQRFGLGNALIRRAEAGMPIWGTCMGMILMARAVQDRPSQYSLGLLDIEVARNAFGAQVHSFEDSVRVEGLSEPVTGVFIRAPIVTQLGPDASAIARYHGKIVAVRQGRRLGTSFHPELTDDLRFHAFFMGL